MEQKKLTTAQKLTLEIKRKMAKYNIPAIFVAGDRETHSTTIVMDARDEMKELNVAILMDAMFNTKGGRELMNIILTTSAIIASENELVENHFYELIAEYKKLHAERDVEIPSMNNTAEA